MNRQEASPAPANTEPASLPRNVKLLGATSLVNDIASEMVYPLLPALLEGIMGTRNIGAALGIIESIAEAVSSILKLFAGGWSDRTGRRKNWILSGYTLSALAKPLLGLVAHPWQVLVCRVGDRIGKGLRSSARDAVIAESTSPEQRGWAFGFNRGMDHLGAAIGPMIALVFLEIWPDRLPTLFLLTIIPGAIVAAIVAFGLREPKHTTTEKPRLLFSLAPLDGNFRLYLVSLVVFTLGNSSDLFLIKRASDLGIAQPLIPALWFLFHIAKSGGAMLAGRSIARLGARAMIVCGWLVYGLVYLGFAFASQAWEAWALFMVYAVYYSLTEPPEKTLVAQLVSSERKGLAYGWYNLAIGLAALPASVMFGFLWDEYGALAAFGTGATLAIVASLVLMVVRDHPAS